MLDAEYTVSRPRRLRLRLRTWLLLLLTLLVAWSIVSYWTDYREQSTRRARETMAPTAGAHCRVVFASDAVGVDRSGAQPAEYNGASNYLSGRFVRMNDQWVVIQAGEAKRWIARGKVLYMEVDDQ